MPHRSLKSMFVELVSFLTLFALIGTMTNNFWERYLIQTELSNMKSSLHVLKETVYNIGTAYDTLHKELKDLVETKETKSSKSIPKTLEYSDHKNTDELNMYSNMIMEELKKATANKGVGITATKGTESRAPSQKELKFALNNATTITRNPLKSTGIHTDQECLDNKSAHYNNKYGNSYTSNNIQSNNIHKCCKETKCNKE